MTLVAGMCTSTKTENLIEVRSLKKHFSVTKGLIFTAVTGWIKAVDGLDFTINKGESFGLVGESGCGKTVTSKLILLLEKPTDGSIFFKGNDIAYLRGNDFSNYRRSVQAVFQDPTSSLNPRMKVAEFVSEPIIANGQLSKRVIGERVAEVLAEVGLSQTSLHLYPHEFSGGQRQRIAIARSLVSRPEFIILDEPVSALDISIRAQILNLLKKLHERHRLAYLMIAHDIAAVKHMSTRIGVMYLGKLVEIAESEELCSKPLHPYTQALFSAALPSHPEARRSEIVLSGEVPSPLNPPPGCHFHPRCRYSNPLCSEVEPSLKEVGPSHQVACHLHV